MQHGETPLHLAAGSGNIDIVSTLCMYKAILDATDKVRVGVIRC